MCDLDLDLDLDRTAANSFPTPPPMGTVAVLAVETLMISPLFCIQRV